MIMCPNYDDPSDEITLVGDQSQIKVQSHNFEINRCSDNAGRRLKGLPDCIVDDAVYNAFISDLQVDVWAVYDEIDYSKYNEKPVRRTQKLFTRVLLDHNKITQNFLYMRENEVELSDSFFYLGVGNEEENYTYYDVQ